VSPSPTVIIIAITSMLTRPTRARHVGVLFAPPAAAGP
jgi:hypothetical protein